MLLTLHKLLEFYTMELRLKELMKAKGMTSVRVAELVGMHKTNISNIINGKQMPSVEALEKFAKALDCRFVDLFEEEDFKPLPITPDFKCPHCGGALDIQVQKKELD